MFTNISHKEQRKTLDQYIEDIPTFLMSDYETIKESIIHNEKYVSKIVASGVKKQPKNKSEGKKSLAPDWTDVHDLVFGIRDNEHLLNTLLTYKKQRIGVGYVFIESLQYISIIIKKPQRYPLIVIRIPIEPPFAIINENYINLIFKFPIELLYNKENSSKSKNRQYRLYLRKVDNDYVMNFETIITNNIKTTEINKIDKYEPDIINILLRINMTKYLASFQLNKTNDLSCTINDMNIIAMKKLPTNQLPITFEPLQNKEASYIEFSEDKLNFVVKGENTNNRQTLLTKTTANYWPQIDYNGIFYTFHDYDQLFKLAHYSVKSSKDSIYYLLTSFLNANMFIILITDQNVVINDEIKIYSFQNLFNKGTQILEMYLLIEDKSM